MEIYEFCAVAVICCILCVILKDFSPSFSVLIAVTGAVLIISQILGEIRGILDVVNGYISRGAGKEGLSLVIKGCAVLMVCELTGDICRRSEEEMLAKAVYTAGRIEIIVIALPLLKTLIETALSLCN